jgi:hypothetical protein
MSAFEGKTGIACKAVAAANSDRSFGVLIDIEHGGHDDALNFSYRSCYRARWSTASKSAGSLVCSDYDWRR